MTGTLLIMLLFGVGCALIALHRGLPAAGWFFTGLLLGPLALLGVIFAKPTKSL